MRKIYTFQFLILITLLFIAPSLYAHNSASLPGFIENRGQWEGPFLFRVERPGVNIYLENQGITYDYYDQEALSAGHGSDKPRPETLRRHTVRMSFLGAGQPVTSVAEPSKNYYNYYYGNDPEKWVSGLHSYSTVTYKNLYPQINLNIYNRGEHLKYDLVVKKGADPSLIRMEYKGADQIRIENNELLISTSLGELRELKPYAWQDLPQGRVTVPCNFKLEDNVVYFELPAGYDKNYDLVIDPILVFGSYTGSTSDNFGMTATYDAQGNLYAGGIANGAGYPVTTGAFDVSYNGTIEMDVVISKFSANGTTLIYSTYLGGAGPETVNSLYVNVFDELILYGATGSSNFPATAGAYDITYNGGTAVNFTQNGVSFTTGTDIYVARFNTSGTSLLACTYIGGSLNDGLNNNTLTATLIDSLHFNYGDVFRGEVIADTLGNIYVVSSTRSLNFPTQNPIQNTLQGEQDAVVFKLDPTMTNLLFSTYIGGSGKDGGYALAPDTLGNYYITGGTTSSDFPTTSGVLTPTFQGGKADGFVARLDINNSTIMSSTYIGTSSYDQSFFVDLDRFGDVYLFGQTQGNFPISTGVYSNPGSAQFIICLDSTLTTTNWSTRIGNGSVTGLLSPTAFLVDLCGNIYISGWGGDIVTITPLTGMPLTTNAFQSSTDGFNHYLAGFERDMLSLQYATYFGGNLSREHVDGGTSRFDKHGIIYQGICAGCWNNDDFPTTPGAVSTVNNSTGCNMGVFKFDFQVMPTASFDLTDTVGCVPFTINFNNTSNNFTSYKWIFGPGDTVTNNMTPVRTYSTVGTYTATLAIHDSICGHFDTLVVNIHVYPNFTLNAPADTVLCSFNPVSLSATAGPGNITYHWSSNNQFTDSLNPGGSNAFNAPAFNGYYWVKASNPGCDIVDSVGVSLQPVVLQSGSNFSACVGDTVFIQAISMVAGQNITYNWSPSPPVISGNGTNTAVVYGSGSFPVYLHATNQFGCELLDTFQVNYSDVNFTLNALPGDAFCDPENITLTATGAGPGSQYHWSSSPLFGDTLNPILSDSSLAQLFDTTTVIYLNATLNGCNKVDSMIISINGIDGYVQDVLACPGEPVFLNAIITENNGTGTSYAWQPASNISGSTSQAQVTVKPGVQGLFTVTVTNNEGCSFTDQATVALTSTGAFAEAEPDTIETGESSQLNVSPAGTGYTWSPAESLSDFNVKDPVATPDSTTTYYISYVDAGGCLITDTVTVWVLDVRCIDPYVFLPNAFSPDGDMINDVLLVRGNYIESLDLKIFNRWGELVFETNDPSIGWDGTYKGKPADPAVFAYFMKVVCIGGQEYFTKGNITLLR